MSPIRDHLCKRKRVFVAIAIACWLGGVGLMLASAASPDHSPIVLIPFLGFVVAILALNFFVRCPRCSGNPGIINATFSRSAAFLKPINYCPYCGVSLDAAIEP